MFRSHGKIFLIELRVLFQSKISIIKLKQEMRTGDSVNFMLSEVYITIILLLF